MKLEPTRIVRITSRGRAKTYNLTMRGPHHNYFAQGLLTANSHSFAYAYLAYQTAYLKAHYPTHFYAAVLSNEIQNTEKVARYIAEMKSCGVALLAPDVNTSHEGFTPVGGAVRFGLQAIKGVGAATVQAIIRARESGGPFRSLYDLAERVEQPALNKRVLEALIKAGACDSLPGHRAAHLAASDRALERAQRAQRDRASGQAGLFAVAGVSAAPAEALPEVAPLTRQALLAFEKETLGFYASGHPLEDYAESLRGLADSDSGTVAGRSHGESVAMGGVVVELAVRTTKKGDRFALFRLEDQYGGVKVVCWPEPFERSRGLIAEARALLVKGRLELAEEGSPTIIAQEVQPLEGARLRAAKRVVLRLREESLTPERVRALARLLAEAAGETPVVFELRTRDWLLVRVRPPHRVALSPELTGAIQATCPEWEIELVVQDTSLPPCEGGR